MMGTAWKMPVPHMNHSTPAASSEPWRKARTITTISMYLVVGVVIVSRCEGGDGMGNAS